MHWTPAFAALFFWPVVAMAAACPVPAFEAFAPNDAVIDPTAPTLRVDMQPVASLKIPSGFSRVGALPVGSIGFSEHPQGFSVVLGFETRASVSIHKKGAKPAAFMASIFKGLDVVGCRYLRGYQLDAEDYRLHASLAGGIDLYAFGKGERHQFYLIRPDQPDFVLTGLFRRMSRAEFQSILSTIDTH